MVLATERDDATACLVGGRRAELFVGLVRDGVLARSRLSREDRPGAVAGLPHAQRHLAPRVPLLGQEAAMLVHDPLVGRVDEEIPHVIDGFEPEPRRASRRCSPKTWLAMSVESM